MIIEPEETSIYTEKMDLEQISKTHVRCAVFADRLSREVEREYLRVFCVSACGSIYFSANTETPRFIDDFTGVEYNGYNQIECLIALNSRIKREKDISSQGQLCLFVGALKRYIGEALTNSIEAKALRVKDEAVNLLLEKYDHMMNN